MCERAKERGARAEGTQVLVMPSVQRRQACQSMSGPLRADEGLRRVQRAALKLYAAAFIASAWKPSA